MKLTSKMLKQMITEEINEGFLDKFFGAFGAKDKESDIVMPLDFRWGKDEIVAPDDKPDEVGYRIHRGRLYKIAIAQGYTDEEIAAIVYCRDNLPYDGERTEKLGNLAGTKWALQFGQTGQSRKIELPDAFIKFYENRGDPEYLSFINKLMENKSGNQWIRDLYCFLTNRNNHQSYGEFQDYIDYSGQDRKEFSDLFPLGMPTVVKWFRDL